MPKLLLVILALTALSEVLAQDAWPWAKYGLPQSDLATCTPLKRVDWADGYHQAMLVREKKPDLQLVFLGDSITMMWRSQSGYEGGTPVWEQYYALRNTGNFGISGDRTEHILWRITEGGDLDGLSPKVLVLLIGINNYGQTHSTPQDVSAGISTIVGYLKTKLPETKILLLGVFPCNDRPENPVREWVRQVNSRIKPLADRQRVWYLDMGDKFVEPDGTITREKLRDLLHLSEKGYWIWAETMEPYLVDLLDNGGKGDIWGK